MIIGKKLGDSKLSVGQVHGAGTSRKPAVSVEHVVADRFEAGETFLVGYPVQNFNKGKRIYCGLD